MAHTNIAILGAGIAGLCCALALNKMSKKKFTIILYERSPKPKNLGAGLVLWPNAVDILNKLDLKNVLVAHGYSLEKMQRFTDTGEFLNEIDLTTISTKHTNYAISRTTLQQIFLGKLNQLNVKILYGYNVVDIKSQTNSSPIIHFENGKQLNSDIIIGADGRMNSISKKYVTGSNKPIYQRYVNWVGRIESNSNIHFQNNIMDYWGCGERFGIVPLSSNSAYWAGCKVMPAGLGTPKIGNKKTLHNIFKHWPDNIRNIIEQTSDKNINRIEVYDHNPSTSWYRDNLCLIGDAAHAAAPTSGQGACQAIEDGYYLAECLDNNFEYKLQYKLAKRNNLTQRIQQSFKQFYTLRSEITHDIIKSARQLNHSIFNTDLEYCKTRNQQARLNYTMK